MSWLDEIRAALGQAQAPLRSGAEFAVQQGLQPTLQALGGAGNFSRGAGMTIGNLIKGDTDAAQDSARRAFSGIANSDDRISAQEALRLPDHPVSNFLGEVSTDPVAALGVGKLAQAGYRGAGALARMLAPDAAEAAAPVSRTLSSPGLASYTTSPAGEVSVTRPSLGQVGDISGQSSGAGNVRDLLPLRRQFTRVSISPDAAGNPHLRPTGGMNALEPGQTMAARFDQVQQGAGDSLNSMLSSPGMQGEYSIPARTATTLADAPRSLVRHENFHGLADIARRTGNSSGLGIVGRIGNRLQNSSSPLLNSLGQAAEEMAAHGAQEVGPLNQTRQMLQFLTNPIEGYAQDFGSISPLAGQIYRQSVIPRVGLGLAGAAGAGAASALQGNQ